ncbi:kinesin-like protein KIN-14E isoform X2 [Amphibalanus amphitrite]|uniref:kinesin-like protein KIN-14E isoform X2 n=1 Tax=Amphibalanus amphitrite TaxID=1232801 RepID=UPI001C9003DB|nr:kinesin-like protein KIN-14E isoform X2 [Amphibalanus amphitrite]
MTGPSELSARSAARTGQRSARGGGGRTPTQSAVHWTEREKYGFLLQLLECPEFLLPERLERRISVEKTKMAAYQLEQKIVNENIRQMDGTDSLHRPELLESLYSQVSHLDSVLSSLEGQIQVLEAVQRSLPRPTHGGSQHDSGTDGHEPDSLEAMRTVLSEGPEPTPGRRAAPCSPHPAELEPAVLLHLERCAHRKTRRQLQLLQNNARSYDSSGRQRVTSQPESLHGGSEGSLTGSLETLASLASSDRLLDELKLREMTIAQLRGRVLQLERARLDNIPLDPAREISRLQSSVLERVRDELTLQNFSLKSKLSEFTQQLSSSGVQFRLDQQPPAGGRRPAAGSDSGAGVGGRRGGSEHDAEQQRRIGELETQLHNQRNELEQLRADSAQLRALEARLEESLSRRETTERYLASRQEELTVLKLDLETLQEENTRLKDDLSRVLRQEAEHSSRLVRLSDCESELGRLQEERRLLADSLQRERTLRKQYFNQMEELKGRIRVFCRLRPLSEPERRQGGAAPIDCADPYTLCVGGDKGQREFQFDRVFTEDTSQQRIFDEVESLVQSSMDGYNVCICAYGQTGSGKTHTLLGDEQAPGVAPRAFRRLFELAQARAAQTSCAISTYMLELYNDRLVDLLAPAGARADEKLEVKKDRRGTVVVSGAALLPCQDAAHLQLLFERAVGARRTGATRMNAASSRSHLVIGVTVEATSRVNGAVTRGKLSLLDLAGSERAAKSGADADQLREANAINKSLSALADVISSLAAEQSFVPYRNSKLTMLMQDSLGGNAKTLMFVNISPAQYNLDETLTSLQYASRVKQITNSAARNADNKEITRLKNVIAKLRQRVDCGQPSLEERDEG